MLDGSCEEMEIYEIRFSHVAIDKTHTISVR